MKVLIRWLLGVVFCCAGLSVNAAFPDLKLPFEPGRPWTLTRGYLSQTPTGEETTHIDYGSDYSDDRYAIDFAFGDCNNTYGKSILAAASGTVKSIRRVEKQAPDKSKGNGYGNSIVIDHGDGYSTRYAHLSSIDSSVAEEGKSVAQGQKIGEAGGTGNVEGSLCNRPDIPSGVMGAHLHFVLYRNGDGLKPEPMSGYTNFTRLQSYTSNNTLRGPAATEPAISCVYVSSSQQFCWKSDNATPALCSKAKAWILYDYASQTTHNKSASDCSNYCTASNSYCKDLSGSLSVGGFGMTGSDRFNLKQDFDILDPTTGNELRAGFAILIPGQTVKLQVEAEAKDGDVRTHMRPGKDSIKIDYYYRLDDQDWVKYKTDTIQANNLGTGKKTEYEYFTIPNGIQETISFKVKIDGNDDAYESNEGDNWSRIETFQVEDYAWLIPIINLILEN